MTKVEILGVPIDMGAGRRGVDMGPSALRLAGLAHVLRSIGHDVHDAGNVEIPVVETLRRRDIPVSEPGVYYIEAIAEACCRTKAWIDTLTPEAFPVILGGDHSISIGSIAGLTQFGRTGVIWVDAHTDLNTPETSPSGNAHGMPVSVLLGEGDPRFMEVVGGRAVLQPQDIVYIGIRSVDAEERKRLMNYGILTFSMKEIDRLGISTVLERSLAHLKHVERIHVSFDADSLDPSVAPGVGTPVPGGLSYREAHLLMELLDDSGRINSLDLVEVNPILDIKNQTAEMMVEFTASLLGKGILSV